jgi:hypothetical protein
MKMMTEKIAYDFSLDIVTFKGLVQRPRKNCIVKTDYNKKSFTILGE